MYVIIIDVSKQLVLFFDEYLLDINLDTYEKYDKLVRWNENHPLQVWSFFKRVFGVQVSSRGLWSVRSAAIRSILGRTRNKSVCPFQFCGSLCTWTFQNESARPRKKRGQRGYKPNI